jgi:signal transduction histidine kinase/CheY-like chemotaxis protein
MATLVSDAPAESLRSQARGLGEPEPQRRSSPVRQERDVAEADESAEHSLDQLKAANFFLRNALDQVSDGLLILRGESTLGLGPRILFSNTPAAMLVGADPFKGLRDRFVTQLVATEAEAIDLVRVLQSAGKCGTAEWQGGVKTLYADRVVRCIWRIRAVQNSHGVLLNYTITLRPAEVKKVQPSAPAQAAEPDALKRLRDENLALAACGMAHDVNNILGIISMRLSEAALNIPATTHEAILIDEALAAVRRADTLTKGVLNLAKDIPLKREPCDVAQIIRETVPLVSGGRSVKIDIHTEPGLSAALVDASRIGQVLQNLIINGIQAMKDGGRMELIARNTVVPQGDPKLAPGRYVEVIVRDRGPGMPPELASRLFSESVTTKPNGNGVGLLSCKRIIGEHGGDIRVSSLVGTGTEFSFFLPATDLAPARARSAASGALVPGVGIVLLVDDEKDLLVATVAVLKRCGYRVYAVQSGEEAVEAYQRLARADVPVDAVVMDLTLAGGLSGAEAMKEIRAFDARARVIASSGGVVDQMRHELLDQGFSDVLPKPYEAATVSQVVHRVLTRSVRGALAA